jgi:hypothetical protein
LPDSHLYLRSLSTTSPTASPAQFSADFPEIAEDFVLPQPLKPIINPAVFHSSPLRISSHLNMWLHYDVMSNILFQVRGSKKLILFPPQDIKYLGFPAAATTSNIDITPESDRDKIPPGTHPAIATLNPGDALFIPPLWCHAGAPIASTVARSTKGSAANSTSTPLAHVNNDASPGQTYQSTTPAPASNDHDEIPSDDDVLTRATSNTTAYRLSSSEPKSLDSTPLPRPSGLPTPTQTHSPSAPTSSPPAAPTTKDVTHRRDHTNISLNIFFHSLNPTLHAAGRDVYGNRDLAAYEDGRRDIEKIIHRFKRAARKEATTGGKMGGMDGVNGGTKLEAGGVERASDGGLPFRVLEKIPPEITKAYLERLAGELLQKANEL